MDLKTLRGLVPLFSRYLSVEKDVSPHTLRAYEGDLRAFLRFLEANGRDEVDIEAIRAYVAGIYAGLRKSSLSRKISSIKVFFKFLKKKGFVPDNPAALLRCPRAEKRLPKFYTVDEMFHFLDTLPETTWIALRNKAIFELIYSTGMRAQETLDLNVTHVHLDGLWVLVKGKGGKERVLPFGEKAREALQKYMEAAGDRRKADTQALFVNRSGRQAQLQGPAEGDEETSTERESLQRPRPSRRQALFCDPHAEWGRGPAVHSGAARPFKAFHHTEIYAYLPGQDHGDLRQGPSEKVK